jgi:hypothetical protein
MTIKEEDFYPKQQNYWERANDNLAGWLGLQHLTTLDVFILFPLLSIIVLPIVFWFPSENWFWRERTKQIGGAYLLYCAFALWHFHARWWLVLLVVTIGAGLCAIALRDGRKTLAR